MSSAILLNGMALHDIQIADKRTDVVTVLDAAVGCVAVVHAAALAHLLVILLLSCLYDKLDVYNLCLTDFPVPDTLQRTTAAFAEGWFMLYHSVWRADGLQCVPLVPRLSAAWFPARLAEGLCPAEFTCRNAFLGRRDTAVTAVLLRLSWATGRVIFLVTAFFQFFDTRLGIGKFRLGRGKIHLQTVYLLVFLVDDAVEPPNLLGLLGVGFLKFTQTLVYHAQDFIRVGTLPCHFADKDRHLLRNSKMGFHIP